MAMYVVSMFLPFTVQEMPFPRSGKEVWLGWEVAFGMLAEWKHALEEGEWLPAAVLSVAPAVNLFFISIISMEFLAASRGHRGWRFREVAEATRSIGLVVAGVCVGMLLLGVAYCRLWSGEGSRLSFGPFVWFGAFVALGFRRRRPVAIEAVLKEDSGEIDH